MKKLLRALRQKSGRTEGSTVNTGNQVAGSGARTKSGTAPKPDLEAQTGPPAQATTHLAFELGDFIARIPENLLKPGEHDLHQPLLFELGDIANRLANGIPTIQISDLLEMVPEIFDDSARSQESLTLRFPWQRVIALMTESDAAAAENGGETLRQKLSRAPGREHQGAPGTGAEAPTVGKLAGASQIKCRVKVDRESVWFSPMKASPSTTAERTPSVPSPQAKAAKLLPALNAQTEPPATAPDLVALPDQKREAAPNEPLPLGQRAHLGVKTASEIPNLTLCPVTNAGNSPNGGLEQRKDETRPADLEGQLETFSQECHHRVSNLRADTARLMQKARAEMDDAFAAAFSRLAGQISGSA